MLKKIISSTCFKPTLMLMALSMLFMSFTTAGPTVTLKAGTVIPLVLDSTIDGNNAKVGQNVNFRVTSDVIVDGKTVISAGSLAKGQVVRSEKNGLLGSAGEVEIAVKSIQAVDGTNVYLADGNVFDEGSNKLGVSIVVTLFCLFGFLIKGGKAQIPAGTQINATVLSNAVISVK